MRYIGSKERLLEYISNFIFENTGPPNGKTFADLFSGTAVVVHYFKNRGFRVIANDNLNFCSVWAKAALLAYDNKMFHKLVSSENISNNLSGNFDEIYA